MIGVLMLVVLVSPLVTGPELSAPENTCQEGWVEWISNLSGSYELIFKKNANVVFLEINICIFFN